MSAPPSPYSSSPGAAFRSRTRGPEPAAGLESLLDGTTAGLLGGVALLLLAGAPDIPPLGQTGFIIAGTGALLLTLGMCRRFAETLSTALRRGPTPLILLLVCWGILGFFLSPHRPHATAELLRLIAGAAAYGIAAYALPTERQLGRAVAGLALFGVGLSLYDMTQIGTLHGGARAELDLNRYSAFGTHENVGSLLVLLLPPMLAVAVSSGVDDKPRYAAQFAAFVLGFALLLARTRSAWIGGVIALILLCLLILLLGKAPGSKAKETRRPGRRSAGAAIADLLGSPALLVIAGFALLVAAGGILPSLSKRATTLSRVLEDNSFAARLQMWEGAARMARQRPVTGWGLGYYLVEQGSWTHSGDDATEVVLQGTGHQNIAHNYYVQWAADTGGVGLLLHVATLATFVFCVVGSLRGGGAPTPLRRAVAIGAVATVVGAAADAVASPAYNFHGVSTILWVWVGLGIGALRTEPPRESRRETASSAVAPEARPALPEPTRWPVWTGGILTGALAVALVIGWGEYQIRLGQTRPRGTFRVVALPGGVKALPNNSGTSAKEIMVQPGTPILWKAYFTDETGVERQTVPGTAWKIEAEPIVTQQGQVVMVRSDGKKVDNMMLWDKGHAVLRIIPPATAAPITVTGLYQDRYNRIYQSKAAVVRVSADAPAY